MKRIINESIQIIRRYLHSFEKTRDQDTNPMFSCQNLFIFAISLKLLNETKMEDHSELYAVGQQLSSMRSGRLALSAQSASRKAVDSV